MGLRFARTREPEASVVEGALDSVRRSTRQRLQVPASPKFTDPQCAHLRLPGNVMSNSASASGLGIVRVRFPFNVYKNGCASRATVRN